MIVTFLSEEDTNKYVGKYVAVESFTNNSVVAHGNDLNKVLKEANKLVDELMVFCILDKHNVYTFKVEGVGVC